MLKIHFRARSLNARFSALRFCVNRNPKDTTILEFGSESRQSSSPEFAFEDTMLGGQN